MDERFKELVSVLKKDPGIFGKDVYNNLVVIDGVQSKFNENDLINLYIAFVLVSGKKCNSLEELYANSALLMNSSKLATSFENFKKAYDKEEWLQIEQNVREYYPFKLYASIDNSDLCLVAYQLIQECIKRGRTDFSFKVNLRESINRRDNLVMYCTEENLQFYCSLLKKVTYKAKFNGPHLLSHNLGHNIYGGYDYDNGRVSYTEKLSEDFYEKLCDSVSPEEIASDFYLELEDNQTMGEIIEDGPVSQIRR